jgi:hypothetical protein
MAKKQVFRDDGAHWIDFSARCVVACPDCGGQAVVERQGEWVRRFLCPHCVRRREMKVSSYSTIPTGCDPWFGYTLWLQTPCCGDTLWAFNLEHLTLIEDYVRADLRQGIPLAESPASIRNSTMASRLPKWLIRASHRDDVLRCIAKLRERALQVR